MLLGVDIGGTKCALILAENDGKIQKRVWQATDDKDSTLGWILETARGFAKQHSIQAVGISCGGPLDSGRGLILSPPNLPGWDAVPITALLTQATGAPAYLCNDANACALAEWKYGAGRGCRNMVFLTFGTGMGAGLILNGQLYEGANGMAGEVGHIRLAENGPEGYGKAGSFEGFCSGGGISRLAREMGIDATARVLAERAARGDVQAREVFRRSAQKLGQGLAVLMDVLNPERIVIGSVFARSEGLFREEMERVIREEALVATASACRVVPAELGDSIGDQAAIAVACRGLEEKEMFDREQIFTRYPALEGCRQAMEAAAKCLVECARSGGTVLVCGNGGSAADSEHIVGELMKGFLKQRPLTEANLAQWTQAYGPEGEKTARGLQGGIRAISLPSQTALLSAVSNDTDPTLCYAQLAWNYARPGDVLLAVSTSGNAANVVEAARAVKLRGGRVIALTGMLESRLQAVADITLAVPENLTYKVQELHLPVYHWLCACIEDELFER